VIYYSTKDKSAITQIDKMWMLLIILIYSAISFINLGRLDNPQTFWSPNLTGDYAVLGLSKKEHVLKLRHFAGPVFGNYKMYISDDNKNFRYIGELKQEKVFAWKDTNVNQSFRYLAFKANDHASFMGDLGIYNKEGKVLETEFITKNAKVLVDETDKLPDKISYLNSTYFDEIYHVRTAYEHVHKMRAYEWTHPPLGKLIIGLSIRVFGITPFSYRLMGEIAGISMLAVIYILAKRLFGETRYAVLAAVLLASDGMHFVQTRIATVDSFLVLFIMLAYLFMYQYIKTEDNGSLGMKLIHLFFSGLFMGAGIAVKWSGVYGGIGLAVIFFINFFTRMKNKYHNYIWKKQVIFIVIGCIIFFILIPFGIYLLSYIPFFETQFGETNPFGEFIKLQKQMYKYHSELQSVHPYGSAWYLWPLDIKPVWYYKGMTPKGFVSTIVAMGNPIIWWSGAAAAIYLIKEVIVRRKEEDKYIIIALFSLYIPYAFIPRVMFLYHYFPVVPFLILAIVSSLRHIIEAMGKSAVIQWYGILAVINFIFFYPIWSGLNIPIAYAVLTRWFPIWQFY
jgi:dolichyl-phosphate-mannose--protein O-mannosyl transferase